MYADGFLNQRQRHPYAMGAAITLNLVGVAAVMLAKGEVIPLPPPPTIFTTFPIDPPPPPPHTVKKPEPPRAHATPMPESSPIPLDPIPPIDTSTLRTETANLWPSRGTVEPPAIKPTPAPTATPRPPVEIGAVQLGSDLQPPYPPAMQRQGIEGNVVLRVLIGTDGRVKQVEIVSSTEPAFADAAERQALRKWRFRPATRDGQAVESWKKLTVRFQIRG